jgi:hypothetical protein
MGKHKKQKHKGKKSKTDQDDETDIACAALIGETSLRDMKAPEKEHKKDPLEKAEDKRAAKAAAGEEEEEEDFSVQRVLDDPTKSNMKYEKGGDNALDIHSKEDHNQWMFCNFTGHNLRHPFLIYSFVATCCSAVCFQGSLLNPKWTVIAPSTSAIADCMGALDDKSWVQGDWHKRCYAATEFGPSYSSYAAITDITVAHTPFTLEYSGGYGGTLINAKGICGEFNLYPECPHMREDFGLVSFLGYKCKAVQAVCTSKFVTMCNALLQLGVAVSLFVSMASIVVAYEICYMPKHFRTGPKTKANMHHW